MFVLNKKTGNVQECHNMDAIKACRKDPETYTVSEKQEDLAAGGGQGAKKTLKKEKSSKAVKNVTKETTEDENGDGRQQEPDEENLEDGSDGLDEEKLAGMDLSALMKMAEELGISGCDNMNKETLVAMILNH